MIRRRLRAAVVAGLVITTQLTYSSTAGASSPQPPARAASAAPAREGPVNSAAAAPVDYAYDAAGQLRGVSTSVDGAGARYSYDDAGNPTGITRSPAGELTVTAIAPSRAPVGASVTIGGTGFAASTGGNTVRFNGTPATVTAASAAKIVATVPAGATSGDVTVTTGSATASSAFTVTAPTPAPTVSGFSPATGAEGTTVTITGTGFAAEREQNNVSFGRTRARVTAASTTSLTVVVPGAAVSGKISVATPGGSATSANDFVAVSRPFAAGDIGFTGALAIDGSATTVNFGAAGKVAVLRFDGTKGQRLSLGLTGSTVGDIAIYGFTPYGGSIGRDEYDSPWLQSNSLGGWSITPLPTSGSYQIVLEPTSATATGTVTATLSSNVLGTLALNGATTAVNFVRAGQQAELTIDASANQRIGLGVSGVTLPSASLTVEVRDPQGVPVVFARPGTYGYWRHVLDLPEFDADFSTHAAGRYTVLIRARDQATGSVTLTASTPHDAGSVAVGSTRTVSVTRPGQDSRITFTGTAGQSLGLEFTDYPMPYYPTVELLAPDGSTLALFGVQASWSDLPALPANGTYTLLISTNSGIGDYTLGLHQPAAGGALSLTGAGTSVPFTAGRAVSLTVPITSGDEFTLAFSNWTLPADGRLVMSVSNPAGAVVHDTYVYSLSAITVTAATTGTYRIVLRPSGGVTGSVLVTASSTIAGGALTVGSAKTVTSPRLGQPTRMTFTGSVGQRLSLSVGNYGYTYWAWARLTRPDGSRIYDGWLDDIWLAMEPFTAAGTYQLDIQPRAATGGSLTFTLVQAIDAGATTVGGAAKTLTASSAGRYVDTTMTVTAGQRLSFGFTGWTFAATSIQIRLVGPSGALILAEILPKEASTDTYQLPAGTYRLSVMASDRGAGAVTLTASAQISGGSWALNAAKTVTAPRVGQATWFTYAGTAGQNLAITYTNVTMPYYPYVWVRRPNGEQLAWINGAATVTIPTLPTTGTYEILISPYSFTGNATATLRTRTAAAAPPQLSPRTTPQKIAGPRLPARNPSAGHATPSAKKYPGGQSLSSVNTAAGDAAAWRPSRDNLAGNGWSTGRGTPQRVADPVRAGPGVTALSGRVRTLDDKPLPDVTVSVDDIRGRTDAQGRFLLTGLRAGHRVLRVDGASASTPQRRFGLHDIGVDLAARQTTVLPYTIWMSKLDTEHTVRFDSPTKGEVTVGTPAIPGLEVKLPAGAVVRDVDGKVVTELGITAIPVDRAPFPLPRSQVPSYFTVQPGSSYVFPSGARVIYPNFTHARPGAVMDFWHYDPAGKGWYVYGHGTVTRDGKRVEPDAKTRVYQFTGAMLITPGEDPPPEAAPQPGGGASGADPVDLGTGLLVDEHTDLVVDDVMPLALTRTYQQSDTGKRAFGIGTNFSFGLDLYSENRFYDCWLILPDGGRIRFHRTSPGGQPPNGYVNATFVADPTPTEFNGAVLAWNGDGWDLRLTDGTTYIFGDESPLQAIRDKFGNTITLTRAPSEPWTDGITRARGPITQITSPNGKWIKLSYDSAKRVTRAENVLGHAVTYTYDADGRLSTVTDVTGGVTVNTYENGRLTSVRDARGTVYLTNTYDSAGRVSRQVMPGGATYGLAYTTDGTGRITETRLTDPRGHVRRVTFDAGGFMATDTAAYGTASAQTLTITRDATTHLPTAYVDALSRRTELTYDAAGNIATVTELAGTAKARTTVTERAGPFRQISKVTDPLGHTTTFGYRTDGALHTVTDPANRTVTVDTAESGQAVKVTDPLGNSTRYGYQLGDEVSTTGPLGDTSRVFYDGGGRQTRAADALGNVTTATWDEAGRLRTLTDALGRTSTFAYDANGNLHQVTDARGNSTTYDWDASDRLVTVTDPLNRITRYTYDANGNTASVVSASGKQTGYAYDDLDRVAQVRYGVSGTTQESQATYTYDAGDRLRTVADSAAGTVSLTPDEFDRTVQVTDPNGTVSYAYDAADRRTTMTVAGQSDTTYTYNDADQLTTVVRGSQTASIGYDGAGRRSSLTLPAGVTQTYAYDDASRLTGITYQRDGATLGTIAYTRDRVGRVTQVGGTFGRVALPEASAAVTYDAADQRSGNVYDADGNVTSGGGVTYTWNARNQLTSAVTDGATTTYAYDAFARRAARTAGGTTTSYVYDGYDAVQEKTAGAVSAALLGGVGVDEIFARTTGAGSQSLLTDALGSTVATADASAIAAEYTYEPFGATTATGDDLGNPLRFTGREDDGNGLYYYRSRYYMPGQQQFLSRDPLGLASGGTNPYTYVGNEPTGLVDPMGTKPKDPRDCNGGGGGGGGLPEGPDDDPRKIIEDIAQAIVDQGFGPLDAKLTQAQWDEVGERPWRLWQYRGHEVHKATDRALRAKYGDRFKYRGKGPDFYDTKTGKDIELTTKGEVWKHKAKAKEGHPNYDPRYGTCDYAIYKWKK